MIERDDSYIYEKDPKYWDNYIWIGPKFVKVLKYSDNVKKYIKDASKYASSIIMPKQKHMYSRNNRDWYNSWKETFTNEEWENMMYQINNPGEFGYIVSYLLTDSDYESLDDFLSPADISINNDDHNNELDEQSSCGSYN